MKDWIAGAPRRGTVKKAAECRHCQEVLYWDRYSCEWRHRNSGWVQCGKRTDRVTIEN